ncbi:ABC transporter permease [Pengzhenrongella sicca]|uniref:Autoinducer 2 import system permease protein LsrC n=1 Tax=Pengzhenrongella sicca TaxID=2819238 RepID=A0A8A4Z7X2_9MICO|nr:ABC transporter permease [Pengzhenrongella sicca]QTE27952.1 ABC transporter permease [Pengzhenrongella sicca]
MSRTGSIALRVRFLGVVVFLLLLVAAFALVSPQFLTVSNGRTILFTAAILVVAVAGQTIVVLTGNLDLSVGSIMGFTAYVVYDVSSGSPGLQAAVVPLALVVGAVLGWLNGFLVAVLEIPSIVATLGTLAVYRGATAVYADSGQVTSGMIPGWVKSVSTGTVAGIPYYVLIAAAVVALVGWVLSSLPWGRRIYAYGSNPRAARFFGLDPTRIVIGAYVAAGMIAALAGLMLGGQVGVIGSLLANGYEIQVLAAAVIGGVSIWGGSGSVVGAALGAVVLATINNGLVQQQVQEYYRLLIQGVTIILAVGVDAVVQRRVTGINRRRRIMEVAK